MILADAFLTGSLVDPRTSLPVYAKVLLFVEHQKCADDLRRSIRFHSRMTLMEPKD